MNKTCVVATDKDTSHIYMEFLQVNTDFFFNAEKKKIAHFPRMLLLWLIGKYELELSPSPWFHITPTLKQNNNQERLKASSNKDHLT